MGGPYGSAVNKGDNPGWGTDPNGNPINSSGAPNTGTPGAPNTSTATWSPQKYTPLGYGLTPQSGYTGIDQQLQQAFALQPSPYAAPRTGLQNMYASPWTALYGGPQGPSFAQMYGQDPMQGRTPPPGVYQPGTTPPPTNGGPPPPPAGLPNTTGGVPGSVTMPGGTPPVPGVPPPGGPVANRPPMGGNKNYLDEQLALSAAAGHVPGQGHRSVPGWTGPEMSQGRWKPGGSLYGLTLTQQGQFSPVKK